MKCRACGFEIADKAIVCYRCGTPTAEVRATPARVRRRRAWPLILLVLVLIAAVLGVWLKVR